MKLFVATNNKDKLREIRRILTGNGWEVLGSGDIPQYPEPEENGETLLENALIKAREGFTRSNLPTVADDTGLEVDALGGRPGVFSARYAGENATYDDNVNLLLKEMENVPAPRRQATFKCVMALVGPGYEKSWEGVSAGSITTEPTGCNGFGYDPVFYSDDLGKTFASASLDEKNKVSHRGRALAGFKDVLTEIEKIILTIPK